jgi:hypothetical protein
MKQLRTRSYLTLISIGGLSPGFWFVTIILLLIDADPIQAFSLIWEGAVGKRYAHLQRIGGLGAPGTWYLRCFGHLHGWLMEYRHRRSDHRGCHFYHRCDSPVSGHISRSCTGDHPFYFSRDVGWCYLGSPGRRLKGIWRRQRDLRRVGAEFHRYSAQYRVNFWRMEPARGRFDERNRTLS